MVRKIAQIIFDYLLRSIEKWALDTQKYMGLAYGATMLGQNSSMTTKF